MDRSAFFYLNSIYKFHHPNFEHHGGAVPSLGGSPTRWATRWRRQTEPTCSAGIPPWWCWRTGRMGRRALTGTPSTNWILQFTQLSNGDHKQESEFTQLRFHFNQLDLTKKCKQFLKQCLSVVIVVIECLTSSV